jgi:DNA-binding MarR family transcriptional regulator
MELLHRYLTDKADWYEQCLEQYDRKRGLVHVKPTIVPLLKVMERGKDSRMHMLAIRMGVTKRRVSQIVAEGIECGLLALVSDPNDARVAMVRVTDEGQRICDEEIAAMHSIEVELAKRIGRENVAQIMRLLAMDWGPPLLAEDSPEPSRRKRIAENIT